MIPYDDIDNFRSWYGRGLEEFPRNIADGGKLIRHSRFSEIFALVDMAFPVHVVAGLFVGDDWVFPRGLHRIQKDVQAMTVERGAGVPLQSPEVVLACKSRSLRDKDRLDFANIVPMLGSEQLSWLLDAVQGRKPRHDWEAEIRWRLSRAQDGVRMS